jgi:HlyD family secretion protein
MKPRQKWIFAAVALALLVTAGLLFQQRGTPVQAVPVLRSALVQSVVATGRLNAPARIELAAEVTATVQSVLVREGDHVKLGQGLVRLSDAEARAALQQAQAALGEARNRAAQQAKVAAPVAVQTVLQAEAAWRNAEREFQRAQDLVAQGFFSQQKLDEARRTLDTTASALQSARLQAEANQPRGIESGLAADRVAQALAAVQMAEARLARLVITSPVDGVVLSRHVEPGSMAQPSRVLLALAAGNIRIDAAIDEKHLHILVLGMPARAVADAYPTQPFEAQLSYIGPAVDPQRGTVEVRLALPQPPAFLKPDMTVSVELIGENRPAALVLPAAAVREADSASPWVLVLKNHRAVRVPVTLGLRGIGTLEIVSGLAAGDLAIPQTEKALPGDQVRQIGGALPEKGMEVPSFISQ